MPFEERTIQRPYEGLIAAIEQVLRNRNAAAQTADEPRVIWEDDSFTKQIHVTVVWDQWSNITPEARGKVILDAVERAMGQTTASRVKLALGITTEQAKRMGVQ